MIIITRKGLLSLKREMRNVKRDQSEIKVWHDESTRKHWNQANTELWEGVHSVTFGQITTNIIVDEF